MRVAINVEQLLTPSPGGVGRYAAQLATHLVALGVEVIPVVARHTEEQVENVWRDLELAELLPRPRRLPLPRPVLYDAWNIFSWPPMVGRGQKVDVLHAPSLAVPPRQGSPLVVSVHDAAPWRHPEAFTSRGLWFHRAGLRAALKRADVILTGTAAAADELAELAHLPLERTRVVPYGVDLSTPRPAPAEIEAVLARHHLGSTPYVLWVGSLEPRKGVATLVSAMARLAGGGPAATLVLAGFPGWQNADLLAGPDVAALGPFLRRLGRVGEAELRALYAGASVFAFPSVHEGFGLPVLEAMAGGAPVVCSDIPPLREVADGAAVLVPPGEVDAWAQALAGLLGSPGQRAALVAKGRGRAEQFSWEATATATLGVYRELVG